MTSRLSPSPPARPPRRRRRRPAPRPQFDMSGSMKRRRFERLFLMSRAFNRVVTRCGKLAFSAMIWPRFFAPFRWQLTRYEMPLGNLDPAFHGYKILHLTDLHAGRTRTNYLHRVFTRCLQEKPDLIVITGDLIDYEPPSLAILQQLLEPLIAAAPPGGIACIFGNHDYHEYSWRHVGPRSAHRAIHKRLVRLLENAGIKLLRNQQLHITRPVDNRKSKIENRKSLVVVGLDEMWASRADPHAAFAGLTPDQPILCLQHNPDGIEFLKPFPWQFMLCGHTHGGQANIPFLGPLYVPMEHRQYIRGLYHFPPLPGQPVAQRTMFVSTGLGYSAPLRMRCPPEATLFTLTACPDAHHNNYLIK